MSEAHEKTRIRQLEDAAAHWEHKYANARQYNRNLEERIRVLEAALREIADFAEQFIGDDEDGDERMYKVHQIADNAIPFTAETFAEPTYGSMYESCNPANRNQATSAGSLSNSLGTLEYSRNGTTSVPAEDLANTALNRGGVE